MMYDYFVQLLHHQITAHKMVIGKAIHALMEVMLSRTLNSGGIQLKLQ
jgi:hypothetical protein